MCASCWPRWWRGDYIRHLDQYRVGTLGETVSTLSVHGELDSPIAAMFVICALGVSAFVGDALIIIPRIPATDEFLTKTIQKIWTYRRTQENTPKKPPLDQHR